jgi:hypothetical protein
MGETFEEYCNRHHRHLPLELQSVERFEDGVVQIRYRIQQHAC